MEVLKITRKNFKSEVLEADKPVLIEFWAKWAGPSKKLAPVIEEIAGEAGDRFIVGRVNVDEEMDIAAQFHAFKIPMLVVMKNGEIANTAFGARSKEFILDLLG